MALPVGRIFAIGDVPCVKVSLTEYSVLIVSPLKHVPAFPKMWVMAVDMKIPTDNFDGS